MKEYEKLILISDKWQVKPIELCSCTYYPQTFSNILIKCSPYKDKLNHWCVKVIGHDNMVAELTCAEIVTHFYPVTEMSENIYGTDLAYI